MTIVFLGSGVALLGALAGSAAHRLSDGALVRPLGAARGDRAARAGTVLATRSSLPGLLLTAVVGAGALTAVVARFGASPELPAWVWLVLLGLLLGVVDVREHRLPDRVLLPGTAIAVLLLAGAALVTGRWDDLGRGLLAGLACFGLLLAMALLSPSGLGMGDVKLVALTGLLLGWLGWPSVVTGLLLAFVAQGLLGVALLASRRVGRDAALPFGPALLVGAVAAALLSGPWAVPLW